MRWYGFSNIRPQASVTPFMGADSPAWMGNGYDRYDWTSTYYTPTVVQIETCGPDHHPVNAKWEDAARHPPT